MKVIRLEKNGSRIIVPKDNVMRIDKLINGGYKVIRDKDGKIEVQDTDDKVINNRRVSDNTLSILEELQGLGDTAKVRYKK